MNKQMERLKKQLTEISEAVSIFKSEAVQVKMAEKLFDLLVDNERADADNGDGLKKGRRLRTDADGYTPQGASRKKPGATKVLNQLLTTDFFDTPRSISAIAAHCREEYDSDFKTSELSGILLKLANENKLRREKSKDNNRFDYIKA